MNKGRVDGVAAPPAFDGSPGHASGTADPVTRHGGLGVDQTYPAPLTVRVSSQSSTRVGARQEVPPWM